MYIRYVRLESAKTQRAKFTVKGTSILTFRVRHLS
jgi:hypothetical protein